MYTPTSSMPVAEQRPDAAWRVAGATFLLLFALLLCLYLDTAASMAQIWWRSETFAHGLIVPPIFLCAEAFFALGYRPSLRDAVQRRAEELRRAAGIAPGAVPS